MKAGFLIVASALALAACGGGSDTSNTTDVTVNDETVLTNDTMGNDMMAPMDNGMMNAGDNMAASSGMTAKTFADTAAASDAFEIASAKVAQDKAKSADLKAFANKMITDHSKSTADLKAAASFAPDPTMSAKQQSDLAALKAASASDFDQLYITQQKAAHQAALAALQGYAATGDDAKIKAFAAKTAPVVQGHIDMLQKM